MSIWPEQNFSLTRERAFLRVLPSTLIRANISETSYYSQSTHEDTIDFEFDVFWHHSKIRASQDFYFQITENSEYTKMWLYFGCIEKMRKMLFGTLDFIPPPNSISNILFRPFHHLLFCFQIKIEKTRFVDAFVIFTGFLCMHSFSLSVSHSHIL